MSEEAAFPRGLPKPISDGDKGKRKLDTHDTDFLFGTKTQSSSSSAKKKSRKNKTDTSPSITASSSHAPLGGGYVTKGSKHDSIIEALSFQKLAKGTRLLGVVKEVLDAYALISLPNMLTGYVLKKETDVYPLSVAVKPGEVLAVSILKTATEMLPQGATRRRIQLSWDPVHLNSNDLSTAQPCRGRIISVEDHGVVVKIGHGRTGFCKFDDVEGKYSLDPEVESDRQMIEGRLYDFIPSKITTSIIPLSLPSRETLAKRTLPLSHNPSLFDLLPGTLVQTTVEGHAKNGLLVAFHNKLFRGAIQVDHFGANWIPENRNESIEWKHVFPRSHQVKARIIAVDARTKVIRLSILPHLMQLKPPYPVEGITEGQIFEDAIVIRVDPGIGALLALPKLLKAAASTNNNASYLEASKVPAVYVHISKTTSKRLSESDFRDQYAPSTKHKVRILLPPSNSFEGIATGATSSQILKAHVLSHSDLIPGKIYCGVKACGHLDGGSVMIDFGLGVKGLIPKLHLFDQMGESDYRTKLQKELFSDGKKVDVKVLTVDAKTKKCLVTAKKSLLQSGGFQDYHTIEVGQTSTGFVSKLDKHGLCVTFYNQVYGRVTARSLAAELGIENHMENYSIGDVIQVRVISCHKRLSKNRGNDDYEDESDIILDASGRKGYWELNLSLQPNEEQDEPTSTDTQPVHLSSGAILTEKSMKVVEISPSVDRRDGTGFVPGHAILRIKAKFIIQRDRSKSDLPYVECKLPFDQLADSYEEKDISSKEAFDEFAGHILKVGKKLKQKGLVLSDPKKSNGEYISGIGRMPIISLRPKLVAAAEENSKNEPGKHMLIPGPGNSLFMGATVLGYVTQADPRYGSFVRFLDGLTGLIPKLKQNKRLPAPKYKTVTCKVIAIDVTSQPPKILLKRTRDNSAQQRDSDVQNEMSNAFKVGDIIGSAEVTDISPIRVLLQPLDKSFSTLSDRIRLHISMAESSLKVTRKPSNSGDIKESIQLGHPFYKWAVGTRLSDLKCVAVTERKYHTFIEVSNRNDDLVIVPNISDLTPHTRVHATITSVSTSNTGIWVQISPDMSCFIPGLEFSEDITILNNLSSAVVVGARIECCVMEKKHWKKKQKEVADPIGAKVTTKEEYIPTLSVLLTQEKKIKKPSRGDLIVGQIKYGIREYQAPYLMADLRGSYKGRCCITELDEKDDWVNMPLGRQHHDPVGVDADSNIVTDDEEQNTHKSSYENGKYVQFRVLAGMPANPVVDVSLRPSRLEGDLDEDDIPKMGALVQGYVITTNPKGCFVRLSRTLEGRVVLKELCDGFLPNPGTSFPTGRLVVGKVKAIHAKTKRNCKIKSMLDLDMRESQILEGQEKLSFDDVGLESKHKAVVTRIEEYGVFVRIENSNVSGLVHKSECSDNYVKALTNFYDPGDLVKVVVIKKDAEEKRIGFSMKASHFADDEDSSDDSSVGEDEMDIDSDGDIDGVNSDDEDYVSKLAKTMENEKVTKSDNEDNSTSDDESDTSSEEDGGDERDLDKKTGGLDTDVGFDWGAKQLSNGNHGGISENEADDDDDEEMVDDEESHKVGHSSRKKAALRRKTEQEISKRESALADGTADDNPETEADFERLLATEPNQSEHWIRYMAYHLALADMDSARKIATRAFERMDFRQEREKLNVWTALLTMELKYGDKFDKTIEQACQHNNPKQVYLRVCELLEGEVEKSGSAPDAVERADNMMKTMCKKFRDKKTVWIAHSTYLLKGGRHDEAHNLLKRALISLPEHKHIALMSKFAQLEFELGSVERGRTVFNGLLAKYPKRLDLIFVFVDKEVKAGEISSARSLLEHVTSTQTKLNDKQMKSLFKKWYRFEDEHGSADTQEHVKDAARNYVERTKK